MEDYFAISFKDEQAIKETRVVTTTTTATISSLTIVEYTTVFAI